MENKLQQGDFVTGLDIYQFEEIINICKSDVGWEYEDDSMLVYFREEIWLAGYSELTIHDKFTFEEFRERAINTFKNN